MAALDPQAHIAMLERELQWAHLKIRVLEERLRQRRVQVLGPQSETLSDLQLELLAEEEPSATGEEVEAEYRAGGSVCRGELQKVRGGNLDHRLRRKRSAGRRTGFGERRGGDANG